MKKINDLENLGKKYRYELLEKLVLMKQGHIGSIFSMMDMVVAMYHGGFVKFNTSNKSFDDKVLISKGHAASALYPILRDFGLFPKKDWDNWGVGESKLRVFGNISIPGIEVTSGSLGHGVGVASGIALSFLRKKNHNKVFTIISEGELYEGSSWEALLIAKHYNLNNLTIIIDINSLIILGKTKECVNLDPIKTKIEGFGIKTFEVDGHNYNQLIEVFQKSRALNTLNCILVKTIKGKGCSIMENKHQWHYLNYMSESDIEKAKKELS